LNYAEVFYLKEQYREQLYKLRSNIYVGVDKVGRDDHWLVLRVNVLDVISELAQDPKWNGLITVHFLLIC